MANDRLERRVRFACWLFTMAVLVWAVYMFVQAVRIICQIAGAR